jgi:monofunctional biosynthetic peptidoglycan transglycosylase
LNRVLALLFLAFVPAPILFLVVFRFLPVPLTPEILVHVASLERVRQTWRPLTAVSPSLVRAVIGAEDENFCSHHGFDWKSVEKAWRTHNRHPARRLRGASTISQQTARTLFLLPVRSWVRKGMEAYFTVLLEALWPKKRILTAYLDLVDWGHGNFGAEAAAEAYFHKSAASLSAGEATRLAAILPNPDEWRATQPGPYVAARSGTLAVRSQDVARDGLDRCVKN